MPDVSPVPVHPVDDGLLEEQREGAVGEEPGASHFVQAVPGRHTNAF